MKVHSDLKLGRSIALLDGYLPSVLQPLKCSTKPALSEKEITLKSPLFRAKWSLPSVTFHDSALDLISALIQTQFRIRTQPFEDKDEIVAKFPAGSLILTTSCPEKRIKTLGDLSDEIGLDLSREGWSYAVVRRTRKVGTATYMASEPGYSTEPDAGTALKWNALSSMNALETLGEKSLEVSKTGANGYLEFFRSYGSHFVSSVDVGDSLFQVFAYTAEKYQEIVESYAEHESGLSGVEALSFVQFTVPTNAAGYGHAAAIGLVKLTSGDPQMAGLLQNGQWLEPRYAKTDSIFAPYVREDAINVNEALIDTKLTVVSVEMDPLSTFTDDSRKLIWHRVFKAAMYARYVDYPGVAPYFPNNCPFDLDSAYKDSDPMDGDGLLSTIPTANVNLWKERTDLSAIGDIQRQESIKRFSVFASAVQIPTPPSPEKSLVQLPGSDTVTVISHVVSSGANRTAIPPSLHLSDAAFNSIIKGRLHCGEFYGGLRLVSVQSKKSVLIVNGLIFQVKDQFVEVVHDVRDPPKPEVLDENISNVEFSLFAAEARLEFLLGGHTEKTSERTLARRFLAWLAKLAAQSETLIAVQARAIHLALVASRSEGAGLVVPHLRYAAYKDVVENVKEIISEASGKLAACKTEIQDRKREERDISREKALNENIIQSGKLLQNYIKEQSIHQQKLAEATASLTEEKKEDLASARKDLAKLTKKLDRAREEVEKAVAAFKIGFIEWQTNEMCKAALQIALCLFTCGFTLFVVPSSTIDSLAKLGETVQKIQKFLTVYDALMKTITAFEDFRKIPKSSKKSLDALVDISAEDVELPSELEWEELQVGVDKALSNAPSIPEKADLLAAFNIMVLRGKALLQCQSAVQELMNQIHSAEIHAELTRKHSLRLKDLKAKLDAKPEDLDPEVDLVGLSGQLGFYERQMLMSLASVVAIQDRALQYELLRPPTPVTSFTLTNLKLAILNQSRSLNLGLEVQPRPVPQKNPIVFELAHVDPASITNKNILTFDIPLESPEFASFNYVRIQDLDIEVLGIISTTSGKYYVELTFDGNPFWDRGWDGENLKFQASSRKYTSRHDVNTVSQSGGNQPAVTTQRPLALGSDDPFYGKISHITPFSKWHIALPPAKAINGTRDDMKFDEDGVTIRITFYIIAQLLENWMSPSKPRRPHEPTSPIQTVDAAPKRQRQFKEIHPIKKAPADQATDKVHEKDVVNVMSGKSVCGGWDAVLCLAVDKVNEKLQQQHDSRRGREGFVSETGKMITEWVTPDGLEIKTSLSCTFDVPRLQFRPNSDLAQIILPIISGSSERSVSVLGRVINSTKTDVEQSELSFLEADVKLSCLSGHVLPQQSVSITLSNDAFQASDLRVSVWNPVMGAVLIDYFTGCNDKPETFYTLGSLEGTGSCEELSLEPSCFRFKVCRTPTDRDLLQIFMSVGDRVQEFPLSLGTKEPIPSAYDCALIINSKTYSRDMIPVLFDRPGIDLSLLRPKNLSENDGEDGAWVAEATPGKFFVPFPETCNNVQCAGPKYFLPIFPVKGMYVYTRSFLRVKEDQVGLDVRSLKFQFGNKECDWKLKVILDARAQEFEFEHGEESLSFWGTWSKTSFNPDCIVADVDVTSDIKLTVSDSGCVHVPSSKITLEPFKVVMDIVQGVDHVLNPIRGNFVEVLQRRLQMQADSVFKETGKKVSVFFLANVLFPDQAAHHIRLGEVFVPGDMVLFGNFK